MNMRNQLDGKIASIGTIDVSFLAAVSRSIKDVIDTADRSRKSVTLLLGEKHPDDVDKVIKGFTKCGRGEYKFSAFYKVLFPQAVRFIIGLKGKVNTIEMILRDTAEYVFARQFMDDTGSYTWTAAKDELEKLSRKLNKKLGVRISESRSASASASAAAAAQAATALAGMQIGADDEDEVEDEDEDEE